MIFRRVHVKLLTNFYKYRCYSQKDIINLTERGFFQNVFPDTAINEITELCNKEPQTVYAGFDPTSDGLHVGNLLILMNLLHWQRGGHNVIALLGGATGRIGDPSGKSAERAELKASSIDKNISAIRKEIENIFKNHETHFWKNKTSPLSAVRILNNENWYNNLNAVYIIGKIGRYFRMGTMLSRTSVQSRLKSPAGMSFTEFSYQIFQAYDWLHLHNEYNCRFQVGGADQMGNIMSGHELISRLKNNSVYGLTLPLITSETGDKFGKSAGNAVWLSSEKSPPFELYQFFIRTPDKEVQNHLSLFTFDSLESINELMQNHREAPEKRLAQKRLAEQVTLLIHGENGLKEAKLASAALYEGDINSLSKLSEDELTKLLNNATTVEIFPEIGMNILQLAMKAKCFPTIEDAQRIISAGGFYINNVKQKNIHEIISPTSCCLANNLTLLRVGKRNYYILKWLM